MALDVQEPRVGYKFCFLQSQDCTLRGVIQVLLGCTVDVLLQPIRDARQRKNAQSKASFMENTELLRSSVDA